MHVRIPFYRKISLFFVQVYPFQYSSFLYNQPAESAMTQRRFRHYRKLKFAVDSEGKISGGKRHILAMFVLAWLFNEKKMRTLDFLEFVIFNTLWAGGVFVLAPYFLKKSSSGSRYLFF